MSSWECIGSTECPTSEPCRSGGLWLIWSCLVGLCNRNVRKTEVAGVVEACRGSFGGHSVWLYGSQQCREGCDLAGVDKTGDRLQWQDRLIILQHVGFDSWVYISNHQIFSHTLLALGRYWQIMSISQQFVCLGQSLLIGLTRCKHVLYARSAVNRSDQRAFINTSVSTLCHRMCVLWANMYYFLMKSRKGNKNNTIISDKFV